MIKKSHELLARIYYALPDVKNLFKNAFKIEDSMVNAWARPKPSDINPYANGKGNPVDRVEKILDIVHPFDPSEARVLAEHFPAYVDELDRRAGLNEATDIASPCAAVFRVVEANAKLVKVSLGGCDDPENLTELLAKTQVLKSSVIQLEGCLKELARQPD